MAAPNGVRSFFRLSGRARPSTIILAGVGRGEEIPVMRHIWRKTPIIGIEPLQEHWRWMSRAKTLPDVIIRGALWHTEDQTLTFHLNYEPDQRATIYGLPPTAQLENEITRTVPTVSLDGIAQRYGPITNALLWMDIEGGEFEALRESRFLSEQTDGIRWVNVELNLTPPRTSPPWTAVHDVLERAGFCMLAAHSVTRNGRQFDGLYVRREAWEETRITSAIRGKQRKVERLASGRGKTGRRYKHPPETPPREEIAHRHRLVRQPAQHPGAAGTTDS
jgi:FkbM family methyltransferase